MVISPKDIKFASSNLKNKALKQSRQNSAHTNAIEEEENRQVAVAFKEATIGGYSLSPVAKNSPSPMESSISPFDVNRFYAGSETPTTGKLPIISKGATAKENRMKSHRESGDLEDVANSKQFPVSQRKGHNSQIIRSLASEESALKKNVKRKYVKSDYK